MEYKCPKCDANLIFDNNKYKCEYCKSEFDMEYFTSNKNADYILPFKINKKEAIKIYHNHFNLLTPSKFKSKKRINSIEGIYVPCYIYNLDSTGVVEFNADKISDWKSSGIKYEKTDIYKVIRGGNMTLKNITILRTTQIDDNIFKTIEPYNYDELIEFNSSYLDNYKLYIADRTKDKLIEAINSKSKTAFINELSKDIKDYVNLESVENSINLYNPNRKYILLPIWMLNINYKNKCYTYIINGQTGLFKGDIPSNHKKLIFMWIIIFFVVFILLLLFNLYKVIL